VKARVYLDSSAYLASLTNDVRATAVRRELEHAAVMSSVLLLVETERTLVRLSREGKLKTSDYVTLLRSVDADMETFALAPIGIDLCTNRVMPTVSTPRTLDLLHLRTALWFHEQQPLSSFLSLDAAQNHAAAELGLPLSGIRS